MWISCYEREKRAHAYENIMTEDIAEEKLGDVFEIAVMSDGLELEDFVSKFLESDVCRAFEEGNPMYIYGMSATELLDRILGTAPHERRRCWMYTANFYVGQAYAYAQWRLNVPFRALAEAVEPYILYCSYFKYGDYDMSRTLDGIFRRHMPAELFESILTEEELSLETDEDHSPLDPVPEEAVNTLGSWLHGTDADDTDTDPDE